MPADDPNPANAGSPAAAAAGRKAVALARRWGTLVLAIGFAVAGVIALRGVAAGISYQGLTAQVRATPAGALVVAVLLTGASFGALIGYDWSALRFIGRQVPMRTLALASFCGYAIGNIVGIGAVSGGAVRLRIYGAVGLTAADVVRIAIFCSVAFGVGVVIVGLVAVALAPELLTRATGISTGVVLVVAAVVSASLIAALMFLALRRRPVRFRGRDLRLPSVGLVLGQILFSTLELLTGAGVLYVLLPPGAVPFSAFVVVYAVGLVAGIISHSPGGAGIFESVVLLGLHGTVGPEPPAAALVLYRLIYNIAPLLLAVLLLGLHEIALQRGRAPEAMAPLMAALPQLAPAALSALSLVGGAVLLIGVATPDAPDHLASLAAWLPLAVLELARLAEAAGAVLLLILSWGLLRRLNAAFWWAQALLWLGAALSMVRGPDLDQALLLALVAALFLPFRHRFDQPTMLLDAPLSREWVLGIGMLLAAFAWLVGFAFEIAEDPRDLLRDFGHQAQTARALRASLVAALTLFLAAFAFLMRRPARCPSA